MTRTLVSSAAIALALLAQPVAAQTAAQPAPVRDPMAEVLAAAERAAAQAERAAEEARKAYQSAQEAASGARAAVNFARQSMGLPPSPAPALASSTPSTPMSVEDENLPVGNSAGHRSGSDLAAADEADAAASFRQGLAVSLANGPAGGGPKASYRPELQLLASSTEKEASLALNFDISTSLKEGQLSSNQFGLTFTGKLDDDKDAKLVGFDGFPNGGKIELGFTHYWGSYHLDGIEKTGVAKARANCEAKLGKGEKACDPYEYKTGVSEFVKEYAPAELNELLKAVMPGTTWFMGGSLSGTQSRFKYLDRASFSMKKVDHFGYSAAVYGGALFDSGLTSLSGRFEYGRAYEDADPVTICQPITGTVQSQCITAADGKPTKTDMGIVSVEVRKAIPIGNALDSIAIAPKFSYDVVNDGYSVSVPLYLATDSTGALHGGIRALYVNEKDKTGARKGDFTLGLFVGVPFNPLGF